MLVEVAGGLSNEEIAGSLFLSESTVKTHVSRVMAKLGARDRAQLVVAAYESGVVRPHTRFTAPHGQFKPQAGEFCVKPGTYYVGNGFLTRK